MTFKTQPVDDDWSVPNWNRDRSMTFRTKPQYLCPILKETEWCVPCLFDRIYQIDYDLNIRHWTPYAFSESLDRSIKPIVIVTIYGGWENPSYRWIRYGIDAIVEERNFRLLHHFFNQDILSHL
jgi:hypothetical protein